MLRIALLLSVTSFVFAAEQYPYGPDSQPHENVPRGSVQHYKFTSPKIFPGTMRDVWVYIPAQYVGDKPAAVMVYQDGSMYVKETGEWRATVVMDNLIAQKSMPITVGIFLQPGSIPPGQQAEGGSAAPPRAKPQPRNNRSYEYDSPTDRYARFLLQEILPDVQTRFNLNLTTDPNLRGLCGASSGGICAFNVAFQRPDAFRRVVSAVGSFTSLHGGGNNLAYLVRKFEPRPLRVFLEEGDGDLDNFAGNWPLANKEMDAALTFAGVEHKLVIRNGAHNSKHGGPLLPEMLKYVWTDYHKPIATSASHNPVLQQILIPGEEWKPVFIAKDTKLDNLLTDAAGNVVFTDEKWTLTRLLQAATQPGSLKDVKLEFARGLAFDHADHLFATQSGQVIEYSDGKPKTIAEDIAGSSLCFDAKGGLYVLEPGDHRITYLTPEKREKKSLDIPDVKDPVGIALTPDGGQLAIGDAASNHLWAFRVAPDGSLDAAEPFYSAHVPADDPVIRVRGLCFNRPGQLFAATNIGVQVFGSAGGVQCVLDGPPNVPLNGLALGGPNFDTLYACCGNQIFSRKINLKH